MNNIYIGLDPSFAHFGVTIIDTNTKIIYLDDLTADDHHNFVFMCWSVANLWNTFYEKYSCFLKNEHTYVAQEAPIASGINSGKLNALGLYFYIMCGYRSAYSKIKTYHPMKLKLFHHKKKYTKKDTIKVVEDLIKFLEMNDYSVVVVKSKKFLSITDGEADSFMYAIVTYIKNNPNDKIAKDILDMFPRLTVFESIEEAMK